MWHANAKLINLWTYAPITPAYINRCKQAIFLRSWLVIISSVAASSYSRVSPLNKSLVAPDCLCSLHSTLLLLPSVSSSMLHVHVLSASLSSLPSTPGFIHPVSFISILQGSRTSRSTTVHATAALLCCPLFARCSLSSPAAQLPEVGSSVLK